MMEKMDKVLTVPKWVVIVWQKIPQMPQNLPAQFVCPSQKVLDSNEKVSLGSVVHVSEQKSHDMYSKNLYDAINGEKVFP